MSNDAFRKYLEELSAEYRAGLPQKIAEVDALWAGLNSGAESSARIEDLQRLLHTLAGSARTFGAAAVSETAKAAEIFLEPCCAAGATPMGAQRADFETLLAALRQAAGTP